MTKKFILPNSQEIRELRLKTGLNTREIIENCPVSINHVYRIEKGQNVSYDKVKQIINFYYENIH